MAAPSCCLAGRSALPLEPGDGGHRGMPTGRQGQATEPTKSAMNQDCRPWPAQVPGWLAALAAGGRACQEPSGQIPPPWAWWENKAPTTRAARGPSQAARDESCSAKSVFLSFGRSLLLARLWRGSRGDCRAAAELPHEAGDSGVAATHTEITLLEVELPTDSRLASWHEGRSAGP